MSHEYGLTFRVLMVITLSLGLAGCAARSHSLYDAVPAEANAIAAEHSILIATSRGKAENAAEVFDGTRAEDLSYARVNITIPAVHKSGALEQPRAGGERDASLHFAAREVAVYRDGTEFNKVLKERLKKTDGRALVFIHGYRTPFDGSIYRMAQIIHDSGYKGTPVLFSWASTGRTVDYIYDNNSATVARDGLERTLRHLREAGATRIDIVAHSMGNWVTMEALRQLAISGEKQSSLGLGDVVLASPDIDVDVFKSQLRRIGKPERPFIVLISRDDRALLLSSIIAGSKPRVGDYDGDQSLAELGVIAVDVSQLSSGDSLNHARFADNPLLIQLLGDRLNAGDDFGANSDQIAQNIGKLTQGVGRTLGSAAEIVITTPFEVINIAVGGGG
ncbi:alpha/beta hydrolase [Aquamicrobium zhengzhouense]|uniref:Alpha/beta hydrolase n=1 Tax=Aquamicrobium zhengzhouense TaxID=2781738 RepID=A0ABS0SDE2_9HYPH|nr:alpha/beta hydrolase [Aquamicrobium zhengzhouense]MBI1620665.1 alpha/beta hydrolase [Aquamicrobium zhengzhouense]